MWKGAEELCAGGAHEKLTEEMTFRENRRSESHSLLRDMSELLFALSRITVQFVRPQVCVSELHAMLCSSCELHEYRHRGRGNLSYGLNEIMFIQYVCVPCNR